MNIEKFQFDSFQEPFKKIKEEIKKELIENGEDYCLNLVAEMKRQGNQLKVESDQLLVDSVMTMTKANQLLITAEVCYREINNYKLSAGLSDVNEEANGHPI